MTLSMTIAKGSRTPVSSSACRSAISASNLEKRSPCAGLFGRRWMGRSSIGSAFVSQLFDGIDQLADGFDLRLHVHRDQNVELVLDRGDKIHHRQAVPLEVPGKCRCLGEGDILLVEGL